MPQCECCGTEYRGPIGYHLRYHPDCVSAYDPDESDDEDLPDLVNADDSDDETMAPEELRELAATWKKDILRETVAEDLLTMRYEHGFQEADIKVVKEMTEKWMKLRDQVNSIDDRTPDSRPALFHGLQTKKQEFARIRKDPNILEPRRVKVKQHNIVSFDMADLLARRLRTDDDLLREVEEKSEEFKSGRLHGEMPEELTDILSGTAARFHPHLMRKATDEEIHDLRVPLIFNCDDIEVTARCKASSPRRTQSLLTRRQITQTDSVACFACRRLATL